MTVPRGMGPGPRGYYVTSGELVPLRGRGEYERPYWDGAELCCAGVSAWLV